MVVTILIVFHIYYIIVVIVAPQQLCRKMYIKKNIYSLLIIF